MTVPAGIRVLVCDDEELTRTGVALILDRCPGIEVVATAADGLQAVALTRALRPDVVLMDIQMPGLDGVAATRQLTREGPGPAPKVLALSTYDLDEYVYRMIRAGASGFLLKGAAPDDLAHAVRVMARGEALLAPSITRRLLETFVDRPAPDRDGADDPALRLLTARELQVLRLVADGLSNAEIGAALSISVDTVKTHVSRILTKTGTRDRVQAVVLAYRCGLVRAAGRT